MNNKKKSPVFVKVGYETLNRVLFSGTEKRTGSLDGKKRIHECLFKATEPDLI